MIGVFTQPRIIDDTRAILFGNRMTKAGSSKTEVGQPHVHERGIHVPGLPFYLTPRTHSNVERESSSYSFDAAAPAPATSPAGFGV